MSWLECFVFYFTLGSVWVFTALDSLSGAGLCWSFCLSTFISTFCFSCSSLSHVLVNFYVFGISIMLFSDCIMYLVWDSVIVASWTTMLFYIPLRVILIFLRLWFCDCISFAPNLFTTRYFEQFKFDMCGCGWMKVSGCYKGGKK